MNWLKQLFRRKPKARPVISFRIVQPVFEQWTGDDVTNLCHFLKTPTGQKLVSICGSETLQTGMKEANGDTAAPKAAGMDYLLRFQFNLASSQELARISRAAGDQAATTDNAEQKADVDPASMRSF